MTDAAAPLYTPFEAPYRMSMGLMRLAPEEWIEIDGDWADDLKEKRRLLAERHDELVFALPGSELAAREILHALAEHLTHHAPTHCRMAGRRLTLPALGETWDLDATDLSPLDLAGRLVQEDLCLMARDADAWRLTAASVCFPTRWNLISKKGQPLDAIHDPVPGFRERLATPMARFFDAMKVGRAVWRLNWSLIDDAALYQPKGHGLTARNHGITAENAGARMWLRVERQTLRRFPETDAILFTIRVHRWPLAQVAARADAAIRLKAAMESMPEAMQRYKSVPSFGEAVSAYLEAQIAGAAS